MVSFISAKTKKIQHDYAYMHGVCHGVSYLLYITPPDPFT